MPLVRLIALALAVAGLVRAVPAQPIQKKDRDPPADTCWSPERGGDGHWFRLVIADAPISWSSARYRATVAGGCLAVVGSAEKAAFVNGLAENVRGAWSGPPAHRVGPWIGAVRQTDDADRSRGWVWTAGQPLQYSRWAKGQPGMAINANYAALGPGGEWVSCPVSAPSRAYIIEFRAKPRAPTADDERRMSQRPRSCITAGDAGKGKRWYQAVRTDTAIAWSEARDAALAVGGHLASIASADENRLLAELASGVLGEWTDDPKTDPLAWAGASRSAQRPFVWAWLDVHPWDTGFQNWAKGHPGRAGSSAFGLAIHPRGVWFEEPDRSQRIFVYVVEFDHEPGTAASAAPVHQDKPAAAAPPAAHTDDAIAFAKSYIDLFSKPNVGDKVTAIIDAEALARRIFGTDLGALPADTRQKVVHNLTAWIKLQTDDPKLVEQRSHATYGNFDAREESGLIIVTYVARLPDQHRADVSTIWLRRAGERAWNVVDQGDEQGAFSDHIGTEYRASGLSPLAFSETWAKRSLTGPTPPTGQDPGGR